MANGNITLIQYYIPCDKDDLAIPNAFVINKRRDEIKLCDIIEHFPLEGTYHFRFKYQFKNEFVWLDLNNVNCKPPQANNTIVMKATRISWESKRPHKKSNSSEPTQKKVSNLIDDIPMLAESVKPQQASINSDANFDLLFKS